jgi:signal transduction histidine kinase
MNKRNLSSRMRRWLKNLPIKDPVDRQMASLLQVMLLGLIAITFIATAVNLILSAEIYTWQEIVRQGFLITLIFGVPLVLLRRGHFRFSVYFIVALILILVTFDILSANLRTIDETLTLYTLAILLAGLLIGRRALIFTFSISAGIVLFAALREQDSALKLDYITIAGNFILINGLMSVFIDSFRSALRNALQSALQRESDLLNESKIRTRFEADLRNLLEREQHLNEVTRTISSRLDLSTILSTVVQLTAELVGADSGAMSLVSSDGQTISQHNLFNLPKGLDLSKPVPRGSGLSWHVIETRKPVLLANYSEYSDTLPNWEATGLHSLIEVPLVVGDACLGTLSVARFDPDNRFTERELALVESVGRQTAIAIQNARLFEAQQHELAERTRVEKERGELICELEERNTELTRFNYTVSHELKTPIVTIKGFLGSIERDLQNGNYKRAQDDLHRISNATDKMQNTLFDLLELSRIGRVINPPEEVSLSKLAQEALETVNEQLQIHSRDITVNITPDLPVVTGDRARLREVFENLLANAANYMGEQKSPHIEIGYKNGEELIFFVKDNGIGIESEYHDKIFGLFEKLDAASEGTGVGLALIKRIIEMHGGKIWVDSEGLGKGSTFYFTLPERKESNDRQR